MAKVQLQSVFATLAEAKAEAASRKKNPNKVFTVTFADRDHFVVSYNRHRAMGAVLASLGAKVKVHKKQKPVQLNELISALSPEQLEALKKLMA